MNNPESYTEFIEALKSMTETERKNSTELFHDLYWSAKNIDHNKTKWTKEVKMEEYQEFRQLSTDHLKAVVAKWLK